jgi:hypothetical protein
LRKRLIIFGSCILIFTLIIILIDYSGKVAQEKRYKQYESEPVSVETILAWDDWHKNLISRTESINISFQKKWIPIDTDHDITINQVIKAVGDTTVIIEKAYRHLIQGDDEVVMMVRLQQDTKKLSGTFLCDSTFDDGWNELPVELTFYHHNDQIDVESFGYGTGNTITVSLPFYILERNEYEIDVNFKGLALYEYDYVGT